jgi:hypothetical protein
MHDDSGEIDDLIQDAQRGDETALARLLQRHRARREKVRRWLSS